MFSLVLQIVKFVLVRIAGTGILAWLNPWLLKADKWLEKNLKIDLIKQEKKFFEKYPGIENRLRIVEENSHPCKELHEFEVWPELIGRIEKLEEKTFKDKDSGK